MSLLFPFQKFVARRSRERSRRKTWGRTSFLPIAFEFTTVGRAQVVRVTFANEHISDGSTPADAIDRGQQFRHQRIRGFFACSANQVVHEAFVVKRTDLFTRRTLKLECVASTSRANNSMASFAYSKTNAPTRVRLLDLNPRSQAEGRPEELSADQERNTWRSNKAPGFFWWGEFWRASASPAPAVEKALKSILNTGAARSVGV